jgi:uncharacterized membrane protein
MAERQQAAGPPAPAGWTDERVEEVIGNLLRAGVVASALVIALGGAIYLARHGTDPVPDRSRFVPMPPKFSRPVQVVQAVRTGSARALIQFGLLLLIATPVARVVFSAFAFARQRDYTYVVITLLVLAVLLYSLFTGHLG